MIPMYPTQPEMVEEIYKHQEGLFYALLGDYINGKGKFLSPLRYDRRPGCFFTYFNGKLLLVDFGYYKTHMDIIGYTMERYSISYDEAITLLYDALEDDNIIKDDKWKLVTYINKYEQIHKKNILKSTIEQTEFARIYWNKYGINIDTIFSIHESNFVIKQIEWYKITNTKVYTPFSFAIEYSVNNEKYTKIYSPLSEMKWVGNVGKNIYGIMKNGASNKVFFASSAKDAMVLTQHAGVNTIHFQSEVSWPNDKILKRIFIDTFPRQKYKFYVLFDNDETGIEQAKKLAMVIKSHVGKTVGIIIPTEKDIADEYRKYRTIRHIIKD